MLMWSLKSSSGPWSWEKKKASVVDADRCIQSAG
jgi:hypothetical protein